MASVHTEILFQNRRFSRAPGQVLVNGETGQVKMGPNHLSDNATAQELCEIREQRVGRLRGYSPTGLCRLDASRTFQDAHFGRR